MEGVASKGRDTGFLPVLPPRFALVELAIFAAVIACEYLFDAFPDLSRLNPHPYWIAVLLLSLQYGTMSGLLAAALAIAGTLLLGLPEAEIGESYFNYLVRVWTQPVLWIVVALLLGSFRMRQIEEREELQKQVDIATTQSASLSRHARELRQRTDALERRLAASAKPDTARLLEALDLLATAPTPDGRLKAAATAFAIACPDASASILIADGGGFRQILKHNWQDGAAWRADLPEDDPLARAMHLERRAFSVLASGDDAALGRDAKIAVPILASNGTVIGLLRIEQVRAADLDQGLLRRLAVLARAAAPLIDGGANAATEQPTAVIPMLRRLRTTLPSLARPPVGSGS